MPENRAAILTSVKANTSDVCAHAPTNNRADKSAKHENKTRADREEKHIPENAATARAESRSAEISEPNKGERKKGEPNKGEGKKGERKKGNQQRGSEKTKLGQGGRRHHGPGDDANSGQTSNGRHGGRRRQGPGDGANSGQRGSGRGKDESGGVRIQGAGGRATMPTRPAWTVEEARASIIETEDEDSWFAGWSLAATGTLFQSSKSFPTRSTSECRQMRCHFRLARGADLQIMVRARDGPHLESVAIRHFLAARSLFPNARLLRVGPSLSASAAKRPRPAALTDIYRVVDPLNALRFRTMTIYAGAPWDVLRAPLAMTRALYSVHPPSLSCAPASPPQPHRPPPQHPPDMRPHTAAAHREPLPHTGSANDFKQFLEQKARPLVMFGGKDAPDTSLGDDGRNGHALRPNGSGRISGDMGGVIAGERMGAQLYCSASFLLAGCAGHSCNFVLEGSEHVRSGRRCAQELLLKYQLRGFALPGSLAPESNAMRALRAWQRARKTLWSQNKFPLAQYCASELLDPRTWFSSERPLEARDSRGPAGGRAIDRPAPPQAQRDGHDSDGNTSNGSSDDAGGWLNRDWHRDLGSGSESEERTGNDDDEQVDEISGSERGSRRTSTRGGRRRHSTNHHHARAHNSEDDNDDSQSQSGGSHASF